MALTADIKIIRDGVPGNAFQPDNLPVKASQKVYRGSVAITRSGYVYPASTPQSTDLVWGLVANAGPGTADTGPGITGGTTDGAVTIEVATGTFWLAAGTGSDAFTAADIGATAYLIDEKTVGKTNGGASRPVAGVIHRFSDPLNVLKGLVSVTLGNNKSTGQP